MLYTRSQTFSPFVRPPNFLSKCRYPYLPQRPSKTDRIFQLTNLVHRSSIGLTQTSGRFITTCQAQNPLMRCWTWEGNDDLKMLSDKQYSVITRMEVSWPARYIKYRMVITLQSWNLGLSEIQTACLSKARISFFLSLLSLSHSPKSYFPVSNNPYLRHL